jgi:adenylate cyclase
MTEVQRRRRLWAISLLVSLAVFAILRWVRSTGAMQGAELWAYDHLRRYQPRDLRFGGLITMVVLDEDQIRRSNRAILTDDEVRGVLEKLLALKPKVVGFDIYRNFAEPKPPAGSITTPAWEGLKEFLRAHPNVVTIAQIAAAPTAEIFFDVPPPPTSEPDGFGVNDEPKDADDAVRRTLLAVEPTDAKTKQAYGPIFPSFAMRLACGYLGVPLQTDDAEFWQNLKLGGHPIRLFEYNDGGYVNADASGYQILHDFKGPWTFKTVTVEDVELGRVPAEAIRDKIVIVANISESVKDSFVTPVSTTVPGSILHATQVDQLLRIAQSASPVPSVWSDGVESAWTLLWTLLGGIVGMLVRAPLRLLFASLATLATLMALAAYAFFHALWIPLVPPLFGLLASGGLVTAYIAFREQQEWKALMELFGKGVGKDVARELWGQKDLILQGGRLTDKEMFVTVLFSDLQGFTSASRNLKPKQVMDWLNDYMNSMSQAVMDNHGFINKYMGDGMMAVFGVPIPRETPEQRREDACRAVQSALDMRRRFAVLKAKWTDRDVRVRVGIYSGLVVGGTMGSADRMEYTTVGDTVNTASRFENYRKDDPELKSDAIMIDGCRILIGGPTFELIDGEFRTQLIREDELTGRAGMKVAIYSVSGTIEPQTSDQKQGMQT